MGEKLSGILPKFRLPRKFRDLLHAANLRHGTDGCTSPPKEGAFELCIIKTALLLNSLVAVNQPVAILHLVLNALINQGTQDR